jgi:hypothetical protein
MPMGQFRDTVIQFPESLEILGRYLGPTTDIGPTMATKIIKENGEAVVRTTFRPLTDDETMNRDRQNERDKFDAKIQARLGPGASPEDHSDDPNIESPRMQPYGDEEGDEPKIPDADDLET